MTTAQPMEGWNTLPWKQFERQLPRPIAMEATGGALRRRPCATKAEGGFDVEGRT
jgi:hypothetical protein